MDRQNNLNPNFFLTLVPPRFVVTACYSQVAYKNECAHRLQKLQNETGINKQFQLLVLGRGSRVDAGIIRVRRRHRDARYRPRRDSFAACASYAPKRCWPTGRARPNGA